VEPAARVGARIVRGGMRDFVDAASRSRETAAVHSAIRRFVIDAEWS